MRAASRFAVVCVEQFAMPSCDDKPSGTRNAKAQPRLDSVQWLGRKGATG